MKQCGLAVMAIGMMAVAGPAMGDAAGVGMYTRPLPDGFLQDVWSHFPGAGHVDAMPTELFTADASIHLTELTNLSLTYLGESAGYLNALGYFTFDDQLHILDQAIVFSNFSDTVFSPGDTFDIGAFGPGTNVGFYIIPNNKYTPLYTVDALNPGGNDYTAFYRADAYGFYGVLGWEDLQNKPLSGLDYNDAIVGISLTPSPIPEPTTAAMLVLGGVSAWRFRQIGRAHV